MDLFKEARQDYLLDQEQEQTEARVKDTVLQKKDWSIDQHRDFLIAGNHSDKHENFPILQRKVITNAAFLALSPVATKMLLLCYHSTYWDRPTTDKRRINKHVPFQPGQPKPFKLPYDRVRAAGISSHESIRKGFMELEALGFIELESKNFGAANTYSISNGYERLTDKDVQRIKKQLKTSTKIVEQPLRIV
jgi:hypothetical protein